MDILKYKDYEGSAELDMANGICRGKILFIDDLVTYKSSDIKKLQTEFEEAVDDYIETCKELNRQPQRPLKGVFNVRVPATLHKELALRAKIDGTTLNDVAVRAFDAFVCQKDVSHHHNHNHNHIVTIVEDDNVLTRVASGAHPMHWGNVYVQ